MTVPAQSFGMMSANKNAKARIFSRGSLSVMAICCLGVGCGADSFDEIPEASSKAALSFHADGGELQDRLRQDPAGHGHVLAGLTAKSPFYDRITFMIDSEGAPSLEVRLSQDGGHSWSDWLAVPISFSEGIYHNAHLDLPHGGTHMEVRLRDPEPSHVSFLKLRAFTFEPEVSEHLDGLTSHEQALAANSIVDVTRTQWGAEASRCTVNHTPREITIHHTVHPNDEPSNMPARLRQMQRDHMHGRGYCDIGYHFLVGQDGKVYQGRAEGFRGAHVENLNTGKAGVAFIGTFTNSAPSSTMMNVGGRVLSAIACYYDFDLSGHTVKGHRDFDPGNECPGTALYNRLGGLIDSAAAMDCSDGASNNPSQGGAPSQGEAPPPGSTDALLQGMVHVAGYDDRPIGGAEVIVGARTALTESNGYFSLLVSAGTQEIKASAQGYQPGSVTRHVSNDDSTWVSIGLEDQQAAGSIGRLMGVIYEAPSSSNRLSGASVRLSNGETTVTNDNGFFSLDVPAGTYTMTVSLSGYRTETASRTVTAGLERWGCVGLSPLNARGVLLGVVHEEPFSAHRIAGATVTLPDGQTVTTGANGAFEFEVAPGTYRVTASKEGYSTSTVIRQVEDGEESRASIGLSEMSDEHGDLKGVVFVQPDMAERVSGARVWTNTGQSTYADDRGIYELRGVPAGEVSIYAGATGYTSSSIDRNVEAGRETWVSIGLSILEGEEDEHPDGIRAIAPIDGEITGPNPQFEWENITAEQGNETGFSYRVVVISQDGLESHEGAVEGAVEGTSSSKIGLSLAAGYWQWAVYAISDEGELIASSAMNDFEVR